MSDRTEHEAAAKKPRPCVHGRSRCETCDWMMGYSRQSRALRYLDTMTPSEIATRATAIDMAAQRRVRAERERNWRRSKNVWWQAWYFWRASVRWGWACHHNWLSED